jgi:acyl-CoA thioester hydrolase
MPRIVETYRGVVYPWHCDTMGHMNTQFYTAIFDSASMHILSRLAPYVELEKRSFGWADVRQTIEYKREARAGALVFVRTALKRIGTKSVEFLHELLNAETDTLHATSENVAVLFDLKARKAAALDDATRARAAALLA